LGVNTFDLGEQQYFCLVRRFAKHKMTRYAKIFEGNGPLATPMVWLVVVKAQDLNKHDVQNEIIKSG